VSNGGFCATNIREAMTPPADPHRNRTTGEDTETMTTYWIANDSGALYPVPPNGMTIDASIPEEPVVDGPDAEVNVPYPVPLDLVLPIGSIVVTRPGHPLMAWLIEHGRGAAIDEAGMVPLFGDGWLGWRRG
jgi:hypothetical protein